MDQVVREGECALCGVVMPFDNECVVVFVGPESCLPYHGWCWETVSERVVYVRARVSDQMTVQDLVDLGLFKWDGDEGGESLKDDADDGAQEAVVDASSDTGGSAPPN